MKKNPLVSVIILNYNGKEFIENCIRSVLNSDYDNFELIFVDNCSTDGSFELVVNKFGSDPRLKIIRNKRNLGFAGGVNVGLKYARGEYIVLLNNDTIVEPDWLRELVSVMEKRKDIGIAQPAILYMDKNVIQTLGIYMDKILMLSKPLGNRRRFPKKKIRMILPCTYALGACLIIRKKILKKIGPFDEKFKIFHDDSYWGFLTWLAGYKVATILSSKIYHKGSATISKFKVKEKFLYETASRIALIIELYQPKLIVLKVMEFLVAWTAYAIIRAFMKRIPEYIMGAIFGYVWFFKNLGHFLMQRRLIRTRIRKPNFDNLSKILLPHPFSFRRMEKRILEKLGIIK